MNFFNSQHRFNIFLLVMTILAVVVFISLYFVEAGYGMMRNKKWGKTINNKIGWFLMEIPVFIVMTILWLASPRRFMITPFIFLIFFQIHYLRRALIFPFLLKGNGKMPITIILMGFVFNVCNAIMQGGWIFYLSPIDMYTIDWLLTPQFIIGTIVYFFGMIVNIQSDKIIQNLRGENDNKHYLPEGKFFNYVTSAHYFGEIVQWIGFAILTWSISGAVFAFWTFANLVPRANAIYHKYIKLFGKETIKNRKLKKVFPFIY